MKFEYKKPSTTKNDGGRILVSMTEKEAEVLLSIISNPREQRLPVWHLYRGLRDYFELYKTIMGVSGGPRKIIPNE